MTSILPGHGPIVCRDCWPSDVHGKVFTTSDQRFRVVNDPGAWGTSEPRVLVLGISKGFTQAREFEAGEFDSVPFKDCRDRLKTILVRVGLLAQSEPIDARMSAAEDEFAWGSLVRCSLSGWNHKKSAFGAGTPEVLPAFKHLEARRFLTGCMKKFLGTMPTKTRLVVLLGNDDRYIEVLRDVLSKQFLDSYEALNPVTHIASGKVWVHVAHPSRGNGFFKQFIEGTSETGQGRKRELAIEGIRASR